MSINFGNTAIENKIGFGLEREVSKPSLNNLPALVLLTSKLLSDFRKNDFLFPKIILKNKRVYPNRTQLLHPLNPLIDHLKQTDIREPLKINF